MRGKNPEIAIPSRRMKQMSKQMVRSILAGTALVMSLSFTFPVPTEAAGFSPAMDSGNVLELVLHWFSGLWNGIQQENGHSARTVLSKSTTSPSPGSGTTSGTTLICGGEQGVCIDPNG